MHNEITTSTSIQAIVNNIATVHSPQVPLYPQSVSRLNLLAKIHWLTERKKHPDNQNIKQEKWIIGPTVFASNQLNTPACSFFKQTMSILLKTTCYMSFLRDLEVPDLIFWSQLDGGCGKSVKFWSFWPQNWATLP